jgi:hypothetical protein
MPWDPHPDVRGAFSDPQHLPFVNVIWRLVSTPTDRPLNGDTGGKRTVRYLAMLAGSGRLFRAPYGAANSFETVL